MFISQFTKPHHWLLSFCYLFFSCNESSEVTEIDDYFFNPDNHFQLELAPPPDRKLEGTFDSSFVLDNKKFSARLLPTGYNEIYHLSYTQTYPEICDYQTTNIASDFPSFYFPNLYCNDTTRKASAMVIIKNRTEDTLKLSARMYFQNTSYWYPVSKEEYVNAGKVLDNYYGRSEHIAFSVAPLDTLTVQVPYRIGPDPKRVKGNLPYSDPARVGYYEFVLVIDQENHETTHFNLREINPFVVFKEQPGKIAYVRPEHFKMVLLNERFDGVNDLRKDHIYLIKDSVNKPLYDGFDGLFKDVISEKWTVTDFFEGHINDAPYTKIDYGNRKRNVLIDSSGITLTNPASKPEGPKQKTWGEFTFGPFFKYGTVKFRAKFSQLRNKGYKTPTGIVHNAWLYQIDHPKPDLNSPYKHLTDSRGNQPFEIDIEIWSNIGKEDSWDESAVIFFSIVDYMKDSNVKVKPDSEKKIGEYLLERLEPIQVGITSRKLWPDFFEEFHDYEIEWKPTYVSFKIDGKEHARITEEAAKIPDNIMYLWIGNPMYQDGTWYEQRKIPMLEEDKNNIIKSIIIE